jgi:hypothetical protein
MAKSRKHSSHSRRSHHHPLATTMSIPELRRAMHHISAFGASLGKSKMDVKNFQREWQNTFHKPLSEKVARDYLQHAKSVGKGTRRVSHRGGSALQPAPLAYRLEPGGSLPYGQFPEYINKGFFVPMSDNIANCGKHDFTETVPADMGSNKVATYTGGKRRTQRRNRKSARSGGGLFDDITASLSAIGQRPFVAQNPPTIQQNTMMSMKGLPDVPGYDRLNNSYDTTYDLRAGQGAFTRVPIPGTPNISGQQMIQLPKL